MQQSVISRLERIILPSNISMATLVSLLQLIHGHERSQTLPQAVPRTLSPANYLSKR